MAKYRMICDWHTHTVFSDGKGQIEDNVRAAAEKKLQTIGITDHGPGHVGFGLARKNIPVMRAEIERLKGVYPEIEILLGVEANIMNKAGVIDISQEEYDLFDYVMAGYHYGVVGENIIYMMKSACINFFCDRMGGSAPKQKAANTEMLVNAILNNNIFMVTHPGDKGPLDVKPVAEACYATDTLFEINTHHDCLSEEELRIAAATGVKFAVSSDAHKPVHVGEFEQAVERVLRAGVELSQIVNVVVG